MSEIILSNHAKFRLIERKIDVHEVKRIAKNGHVTKIEFDGTMLKSGICSNKKCLIVVCKEEGIKVIIKTAYYEY